MGNQEEIEEEEEKEKEIEPIQEQEAIKMILVGNSGVGKTSLINTAKGNNFKEGTQISTLVCSFIKIELIISDKKYIINMWDTVGQERFRSLNSVFLKESNIVIFVFDITNKKSFNDLDFWFNYIEEELGPDIIKGIIGNKQDLLEDQEIEDNMIEKYAKEKDIDFTYCSAFTPKVFTDFMKKLVQNYLEKNKNGNENINQENEIKSKASIKSLQSNNNKNTKKKRFC